MARNPSGTGPTTATLTTDQLAEIEALKQEIKYYEDLRKKALNKQSKIKEILDNFEAVIVGDILLDIIPDEDSDEIKNSPIISKTDVNNVLSGISAEIYSNNSYGASGNDSYSYSSYSNYTQSDITRAKSLLNSIFSNNLVKELIDRSSELNGEELYLIVYYQLIDQSNSSITAKNILKDVLEEISTSLL